jgi:hypothetical protein
MQLTAYTLRNELGLYAKRHSLAIGRMCMEIFHNAGYIHTLYPDTMKISQRQIDRWHNFQKTYGESPPENLKKKPKGFRLPQGKTRTSAQQKRALYASAAKSRPEGGVGKDTAANRAGDEGPTLYKVPLPSQASIREHQPGLHFRLATLVSRTGLSYNQVLEKCVLIGLPVFEEKHAA